MTKLCTLSLDEIVADNPVLASPPQLMVKAQETINDPRKSAKDIEKIISTDPGLTTRLLKIVNSAFYGFPIKILSVSKAITVIGTDELYSLILSTVIVKKFSCLSLEIFSMEEFWARSLRCGLYAKALGRRYMAHNDLDSLFVCGLLHDMGLLILYDRVPDLTRSAVLMAESEGVDEYYTERRVLGFDHYQVGARLAENWRLPEVISITMNNNGQLMKADRYVIESALICLANQISRIDPGSKTQIDNCLSRNKNIFHLIDLNPEMINAVIETVEDQFQELYCSMFDYDLAEAKLA